MWVVLAGNFKYSFGIIHIRASCLCCVMGVGATPFRHTFESPCRKFRFARPCLWVIEFAWHHAQLSFMPVLCGRVWRHTFSAHFEPPCLKFRLLGQLCLASFCLSSLQLQLRR